MSVMDGNDPIKKKAGIRCMKKAYPKVDMTPMVDLGFLLITFFVFTTEIIKPRETLLIMPTGNLDSSKIEKEKVLTALLGNNNEIFVYPGTWDDALQSAEIFKTNYSTLDGLGKIIRQKQLYLEQQFGNDVRKQFMLLIKPSDVASYQNVIDALDEVLINDVKKYAIIDLTTDEKIYIEKNH